MAKNTRDMLADAAGRAAGRRSSMLTVVLELHQRREYRSYAYRWPPLLAVVIVAALILVVGSGRAAGRAAAGRRWFWSLALAVVIGLVSEQKKKSRALLAGLLWVRWLACCGADKK